MHWPCLGECLRQPLEAETGTVHAQFRDVSLCWNCGCRRFGKPVLPFSGMSRIGCEWLDDMQATLGRPLQHSHYDPVARTVTKDEYRAPCLPRRPVDGYDAVTQTVYEFLGDEWHGHPRLWHKVCNHCHQPHRALFASTERKMRTLTDHGYTVLYMWESDYRRKRTQHLVRQFTHKLEWAFRRARGDRAFDSSHKSAAQSW